MHLSVIIPAKNEEKFIGPTVASVFEYLTARNIEHEILVVTNKSTDKTGEIVNELQASTVPTVRLLDYPKNGGKGFAVREGMLRAKGDYRLFMDADNSTKIDQLELMMPYFEKGYDVVIGSIRAPGHEVVRGSESWLRIFLGRLAGWYTRIILLPGILDTQRGFKIVTAKATQDIFSRSKITQWGFDMEMLALARKFGYKIKEVPVKWHNSPNTESHPRLSAYVETLLDTLRIKRDLLLGRYK